MTYTWRIIKLSLQDELNQDGVLLENSVVNIKWKYKGEDTDGSSASYVGNTKLSAANVSADDFILYNSVTNDIALGWITDNMTADELTRIQAQITAKIEKNRVQKVRPNW